MQSNFWFDQFRTARAAFCKAVVDVGAEYLEIPVPGRASDGGALAIGMGVLHFADGRVVRKKFCDVNNLLIHISGVHGVEGFAGSAIQIKWLRSLAQGPERLEGKSQQTILFVHGFNPWGMSWLRRVNQENVDLNRNVIGEATHLPKSKEYDLLRPVLMASGWKARFWLWNLLPIVLKIGVGGITQGFSGGQYHDPGGFYFGGFKRQPEITAMQKFLSENFSGVTNATVIDVHTGLGQYGAESLFGRDGASKQEVERISKKLGRPVTVDEMDGKSTYHITGALSTLFEEVFGERLDYVLQEFGTYSSLRVLAAFHAEHHGYVRGEFGPSMETSRRLRTIFFPDDLSWRMKILRNGIDLLNAAMAST